MKVYILKERSVQGRMTPILATYVVNDDIAPPASLQTKLAALGYELQVHVPNMVNSVSAFELSVRDEVRIDHDLEPGVEEWPEKF